MYSKRKSKRKRHAANRQLDFNINRPSLPDSNPVERRDKARNGKLSSKHKRREKSAWWIWARSTRGVYGPFRSRDEAYQKGNQHVDEGFDVVHLNTIDKTSASQKMKARRMDKEGIKLKEAISQRLSHQWPDKKRKLVRR